MTSQLWPPVVSPATLTRQVWDGPTARSIPAIARALQLFQLAGVMELDEMIGRRPSGSRPRLLEQPDPQEPGSTWFVQQHVEDFWLSGNACHLVVARFPNGWPAAVRWFPAHMWTITQGAMGEDRTYYLGGRKVPPADVVHVKRGHDPMAPARGIGIVEQHLRTLNRAGLQEAAEGSNLTNGGVPSVAVITPQSDLGKEEAAEAGQAWLDAFGGVERLPGIFPKGTQIIPLSFNASDQQMIEARKMTLLDVANLTGLDGYWLGAPVSSHTYRSPGPMFLGLLRTGLEPMLQLFEDAWSFAWLPRGRRVRFDRNELTRDDLASNVDAMSKARTAKLVTYEEAREYIGYDPSVPEPKGEIPPALQADPEPAEDTKEQDVDEELVDDDTEKEQSA